MTTWNHRFVQFTDSFLGEDETYIHLCEVFYDADGKAHSYSYPSLVFENEDEIGTFIERITDAASKPLIHEDEFPEPDEMYLANFCDPQNNE